MNPSEYTSKELVRLLNMQLDGFDVNNPAHTLVTIQFIDELNSSKIIGEMTIPVAHYNPTDPVVWYRFASKEQENDFIKFCQLRFGDGVHSSQKIIFYDGSVGNAEVSSYQLYFKMYNYTPNK